MELIDYNLMDDMLDLYLGLEDEMYTREKYPFSKKKYSSYDGNYNYIRNTTPSRLAANTTQTDPSYLLRNVYSRSAITAAYIAKRMSDAGMSTNVITSLVRNSVAMGFSIRRDHKDIPRQLRSILDRRRIPLTSKMSVRTARWYLVAIGYINAGKQQRIERVKELGQTVSSPISPHVIFSIVNTIINDGTKINTDAREQVTEAINTLKKRKYFTF